MMTRRCIQGSSLPGSTTMFLHRSRSKSEMKRDTGNGETEV
jgi:hypothetical protein